MKMNISQFIINTKKELEEAIFSWNLIDREFITNNLKNGKIKTLKSSQLHSLSRSIQVQAYYQH